MKKSLLLAAVFAVSANVAFAADAPVKPKAEAPHAKTRAEVQQELVKAQKDGSLAELNRTVYFGAGQ